MKSNRLLQTLLLASLLFLAACSGSPLAFSVPDLAARPVAAAQISTPEAGPAVVDLAALQNIFETIYERVNPSVVNIQVIVGRTAGFGAQESGSGLGSGFVWDTEGHIVTNAHVVEGADEISVTFSDGSTVDAELVGTDPHSDLAVIRVDVPAAGLQPVELADSGQVKVGQIAIAIGNPFGLQGTMTQGIISGLARTLNVDLENQTAQQSGRYSIPDIIQTDASINPGNSGGVLVDDQGRVIGVTSAIASSTQSNSGVGFVIPSAIVEKFVPALIEDGRVEHSWLGISAITLSPDLAQAAGLPEDQEGSLVLAVTSSGPAQEAGLLAGERQATLGSQLIAVGGDVILAIDGQAAPSFEDLISYLYNQTDPGQTVTLTVLRQGQEQDIEITLGTRPD
jgi:2-alkenal reductase